MPDSIHFPKKILQCTRTSQHTVSKTNANWNAARRLIYDYTLPLAQNPRSPADSTAICGRGDRKNDFNWPTVYPTRFATKWKL